MSGRPMRGRSSSAELRFQLGEVDGVTVLFVAGELDMTAAARLSDALTTACSLAEDRLAVDVSGLAFMDLTGLRGLLSAHSRLLGKGRAGIIVRGASGPVRRIFELTGFTSLLGDSPPVAVPGHSPLRVWESGRELKIGRQHADLSLTDLYVAYFALGGRLTSPVWRPICGEAPRCWTFTSGTWPRMPSTSASPTWGVSSTSCHTQQTRNVRDGSDGR